MAPPLLARRVVLTLLLTCSLPVTAACAAPQVVLKRVTADGIASREALPAGSGLVQLSSNGRVLKSLAVDPAAPLRVLVEFDTPPAIVARARGAFSARAAERLGQLRADLDQLSASAARPTNRAAAATITNTYTEVFSGAAVTLSPALLERVRKLPYVRRVVMDDTVRVNLTQSVPIIRADSLRHVAGVAGAGIRVGIVDTGVDYLHGALGGGFGPGHRVAGGYDFANNDADPMDDHGHGTHVAGIVAGNGGGVVGVAPEATLYSFKVLGANGVGYTSWILAALDRTLDPDQNPTTNDAMHVVNLSLGAPGGDPDDALSLALDHLTEAGVVCCVAAGNDGAYRSIGSPGTSRRAITVGATDKLDSLAWFTSLGPVPRTDDMKPDVMAPGVTIVSSQRGGGTVAMSGTSMATPHMAGCAALLRQLHPAWTPEQVKSALTTTAHALSRTPLERGSGRVDVLDAAAAKVAFSPTHLAFGRVLSSVATWWRPDTLLITNLADHACTVTLPDSVVIAPGAVVHVSPTSVLMPQGGSAQVFATLVVDNATLADPTTQPYGFAGTLEAACEGQTYRVPATFHQHSSIQLFSNGAMQMVMVEDHLTRQLQFASFPPAGDIQLPPGTYDVTASFYPYYAFVTHENIVVVDTASVVLEPEEATLRQTFAYVENDGLPAVLDGGSLRLRRTGSNWEMGWIGFPVDLVLTSPDRPDYELDWTCASSDYLTRWKSFSGTLHGVTQSHVHTNTPGALHHFRMNFPQVAAPDAGVLFYDFHANPPEWGGYFGIGFSMGVPVSGPFAFDFDLMVPPGTNHYQLGNGIEMYPLTPTGALDFAALPTLISPLLRCDRGWPLETHDGVMLYQPASRFSGSEMNLFGGLPVWRGVFHNLLDSILLDEGGVFFAPHLVSDSYGTVMVEPDPEYTFLQAGVPIVTDTLRGVGTFTAVGMAEVAFALPGDYELRTHRDYTLAGQPARLDVSALVHTTLADPNPPSLRAFQVHARGQEADSIDFATAPDAAVHFRMTDDVGFTPALEARQDGAGAWMPLAITPQDSGFVAALPPTLAGEIALRLTATDPAGNAIAFTWSRAFTAIPGTPTAVEPGATPAAAFALEGARPNPARRGRLLLGFSLPGAAPAALELLDVAGRRVAGQEVGALGAGRHAVRLETNSPLRPGIYFARLTQQGRSLTTRLCVVD